jgi:hypothetical protein
MPNDLSARRLTLADLKAAPAAATPRSARSAAPRRAAPSAESKPANGRTAAKAAKADKPPVRSIIHPRMPYAVKLAGRLERRGLCRGDVDALAAQLIETYPVFDPMKRRPLALGIRHQLLAAIGCDKYLLGIVLTEWCGHYAYLRRMAGPSSHRHNLDGTRSAELTEAEKAHAAARGKVLQELWKQRHRPR